jgi:hypothetical protein
MRKFVVVSLFVVLLVATLSASVAGAQQEEEGVWVWSDSLNTWVWSGLGEWTQTSSGSWLYCWPQWDELVGWSGSCGGQPPPQLQALDAV